MGDNVAFSLETLENYLVETILGPEYGRQFSQGDLPRQALEPFIAPLKELSSDYVAAGRTSPPEISLQKAKAYSLYYTPLNFHKVGHLLREVAFKQARAGQHLLDFGCGPGTGSLALLPYLSEGSILHAVDRSTFMREMATTLLTPLTEREGIILEVEAELDKECKYSLILAANVINEMEEDTAFELLQRLSGMLTDDGILLIIDPALREPTQRAMSIRDRLNDLTILYPCTRQDRCPMRELDPSGWCHGTLRWEKPRLVGQLDDLLGFNKHRIKYSAFAFSPLRQGYEGYRVITESEKRPRGSEATLCGPGLYSAVTLPKKERSETNRLFSHLEQHDRISLDLPPAEKILKKDTVVLRLEGEEKRPK